MFTKRTYITITDSFSSLLLSMGHASAKNKTLFDPISYVEPAHWTFAYTGAYHTYSTVNDTTHSFCTISTYSSQQSSGNFEQEFRRAWQGIVAGHFAESKNGKSQPLRSAAGLNYLQDEANVKLDNQIKKNARMYHSSDEKKE